ncbi:malonyl-[acyl-carrier protein] O-methyltransferase BioC, partial [Xanthomonadaceae bacterium JHOS43]|nr:malonyl-[acyl-carrier protein] O-methyltransferase BioC [Xanthomonadaceae bacterium JHOS43]
SDFTPIQHIGDAMLAGGFRDPVLDTGRFTLTYPKAIDLMRDLQGIGAGNAVVDRRRGLTGKSRLAGTIAAYEIFRRPDGLLPATYEVFYAHGYAPEPGQP